jgi:hypothetical protein
MARPTIASFILRFTQEPPDSGPSGCAWRGVIRHVQDNEQAHFTRMEEALAFIARYVDIAEAGAVEEETAAEGGSFGT